MIFRDVPQYDSFITANKITKLAFVFKFQIIKGFFNEPLQNSRFMSNAVMIEKISISVSTLKSTFFNRTVIWWTNTVKGKEKQYI